MEEKIESLSTLHLEQDNNLLKYSVASKQKKTRRLKVGSETRTRIMHHVYTFVRTRFRPYWLSFQKVFQFRLTLKIFILHTQYSITSVHNYVGYYIL